jgi:hypothetical protein
MKTFLDALKKELQKRNFSKADIAEIIADHEEMIETAKTEGLNEDELASKFGDPSKLADDLLAAKPIEVHKGGILVEGYTLLQSYPVLDNEFDVEITLVNEDIKYQVHDMQHIEVHYKNIKNTDDYEVSFDNNKFVLKRTSKKEAILFSKDSRKFIVKVPQNIVSKVFTIKLVSGDAKLEGVETEEFTVNTTSGDVKLSSFTTKHAKFHTVSGDLHLNQGTIDTLDLSMVSGDCKMALITVSGSVQTNTVSGDLKFEQCEAGDLNFQTVSGDCKGENFYPKTVTLRSVSGDLKIKNEDHTREIKVLKSKALSGKVKIK